MHSNLHPIFVRGWDESPTSANLGNDHGFIINEYSTFWGAQSKPIRAYVHIIVESRVRLVCSFFA